MRWLWSRHFAKGIVKEYSAAVARQPAPVSRNTGSGTASFSLCPFSIMLPTTTITAKAILIRFSVNFKSNANARLALDCGKITDSQRNVFQANPDNAYIPLKVGIPLHLKLPLPVENQFGQTPALHCSFFPAAARNITSVINVTSTVISVWRMCSFMK